MEALLAEARRQGAKRYAAWRPEVFDAHFEGPARQLWASLTRSGDHEAARPVLAAYLTLAGEVSAQGLLGTLLHHCLARLVPEELASFAPEARLEVLARVWNLGEGLLGGPPWLGPYVASRASELGRLAQLEAFLVATLDPVLSAPPPAQLRGPFQLHVLDPRPLDDEFLPGEMELIAPAVLSIRDRRRPLRLGVLLEKGGRSRLLGPLPELARYQEAELPRVQLAPRLLLVGEQRIELPTIETAHGWAVSRAGFVAIAAADSQRIFVVESP